jgi:hypothetical protein
MTTEALEAAVAALPDHDAAADDPDGCALMLSTIRAELARRQEQR